jgi:hypothetical protein
MKTTILLTLSLIVVSMGLLAQAPYSERISDPIELSKKQSGFTNGIIGEDDKNVYILIKEKLVGSGQMTIQAMNKTNLREEGKALIFENSKEASDYTLRNSFQTKDGFIFFFQTEKKGQVKIYATTVGYNLEVTEKLSMIFEYDEKVLDIRFLQDKNRSDFVMISQKFVEEGEEIEVEYFLYDKRFKRLNDGNIKTGLFSTISLKKAARRSADQLGNYRLSPKGDLIGLTYTRQDKDDWTTGYYQIGFTDTKTGKTETIPMRLDDAFFDEYTVIMEKNAIVISGFYQDRLEKERLLSDNKKVKSSGRINGTFFRRYDLDNYKLLQASQVKIDEELAKKIDDGNPATRGGFFKRKDSDATDLSSSYTISDVIFNEEKQRATFYCEYKRNYSTTTTSTNANGGTTTRTTYHSIRGNVFIFQISLADGGINWTSNLRKYSHFQSGSSSVYYMVSANVIPGKEKDYIFYQTSRFFDENNLSDMDGEKIKNKKLSNVFMTTLVDREKGRTINYRPEILDSKNKAKEYEKTNFANLYRSDEDQVVFSVNSYYKKNIGALILASYFGFFFPKLLNKISVETFSISKVTLDK